MFSRTLLAFASRPAATPFLLMLSLTLTSRAALAETAFVKHFVLPGQIGAASQYRDPGPMTSGGDSLWVVEYDRSKIGHITVGGDFTEFTLPQFTYPSAIAVGPDNAAWFVGDNASPGSGTIFRITANGLLTIYRLPKDKYAGRIISAFGALWFTATDLSGAPWSIGRISTSGEVTFLPINIANFSPSDLAAGPDGAIWFTGSTGAFFYVARMDTGGGLTTYLTQPSSPFGYRQGLVAGPDGALWFFGNGSMGRITTSGVVTEFPLPADPAAGHGAIVAPQSMVAGPDGALWYTESRPVIARFRLNGEITEYPTSAAAYYNGAVAFASDGALWFSEQGLGSKPGSIGRLAVLSSPDVTPPISSVRALGVTSPANFLVRWGGVDTGSGVMDYQIYVSDSGGPFTLWLVTSDQQAYFPGSAGRQYGFFAVARDLASNQEPAKTIAEARTTVVAYPNGDLNGDGSVNCLDLLLVRNVFGKRVGQAGFDPLADVNHDGVIDIRDITWESQWMIPGTVCR